jgi:hypothetical protein
MTTTNLRTCDRQDWLKVLELVIDESLNACMGDDECDFPNAKCLSADILLSIRGMSSIEMADSQ